MPTLTIEYAIEAERLALEQAFAFCTQMRLGAATAPDGSMLAACEQFALGDGHEGECGSGRAGLWDARVRQPFALLLHHIQPGHRPRQLVPRLPLPLLRGQDF